MDDYLIDTLMDVVANGRKSANVFKKETYKTVVETVRSTLGISVQEKHVGNRLWTLKRLYFEIQDTLNASGFGWDEDNKLVTAPDDVWEDYIRSLPYAQHIREKVVRRYDDFTYLFENDRATRSRASTGDMPSTARKGRFRDSDITPTTSVDLNDDTLVLSSDDIGDNRQNIQWSFHTGEGAHVATRSLNVNGNSSLNTGSTSNSRKRARQDRPCDVIGKVMSDVAKVVKSLAITIHQGKDFVRMSQIMPALEQIEGLTSHEIVRATRILCKDEQQFASFLSLSEHRRLDFVIMLLAPDQSSD
ncbi:L10-interacting MYB domain-containing protein-like [Magnolia sinica]|uniref:L10-interacting MYB domain-containing protein-like n=1 Tax=Magnolia sinica TaxID=86752 RepID=UPI00265B065D|nr:L10-interacting MYB domain-containing protein-like [Magnolia sinica]